MILVRLMVKVSDWLVGLWDQRFALGVAFNLFGYTAVWKPGLAASCSLCTVQSLGTGHMQWSAFEFGFSRRWHGHAVWHVGLLGFTVGRMTVRDIDQDTGELKGKDYSKYYWFFKGLNHRHQPIEEII